jgi:hypothetical protein
MVMTQLLTNSLQPPLAGEWNPAWGLTIDASLKEAVMNASQRCEACGMPMSQVSQHANGDAASRYCLYCTTPVTSNPGMKSGRG